MPTLTIKHITSYRYRRPVAFGEHKMMLCPLQSHDQSLIAAKLVITPTPTNVRRTHDAFGNRVDIARFARRAKELRFESTVRLDQSYTDIQDLDIEEFARTYPFVYRAEEMPDLVRFVERQSVDPDCHVERWTRKFLHEDRPTDTREFLINLTNGINRTFKHVRRNEKGIQGPLQTLELGSGSCRDLAMLMIEAVRSLGMAARFVSGYLHIPDDDDEATWAAATRTPGLKSICLGPVGSISIHPMASLAIATSFASRWCAIRARRYRSMELGRGFRPTTWE